jgi:hypothetical protein
MGGVKLIKIKYYLPVFSYIGDNQYIINDKYDKLNKQKGIFLF